MSEINLGRVQGGGIFYSTASSGTSIAKSTLTPTGLVPLVEDCVVFPNGDLRKITAVSGTNVTCGSVSANFKGDKGDTGTTSSIVKTDGSTPWKTLPVFVTTSFNFEKASWADIAAISESGRAAAYFGVGEEKTIELTTGEKVTLVILGFNHDDLTGGGKAGMTIGMKNLLATRYAMNSSSTNAGGWDQSKMRTETMQTLLAQLPSDLRNSIKHEQYEYWKTVKDGKTSADRIKYLSNGGGSARYWWLRSPYVSYSTPFRYIDSTGDVSYDSAYNTYGVSFGFCI